MGSEVTLEIRNSLVDLPPTALGTNEIGLFDEAAVHNSGNDQRGGLGGLLVARWRSQTNPFRRVMRRVGRV